MCAVCWTGAQVIPVTAVAARYVWVNHLRRPGDTPTDDDADEPQDEVSEPVGV